MNDDDKAMTVADWRDMYQLLLDAANLHHNGHLADRAVQLERKCAVRENALAEGRVMP